MWGYAFSRGWPDDDRRLFQDIILVSATADIIDPEQSRSRFINPLFLAVELNNELLFSVSEDLGWRERKKSRIKLEWGNGGGGRGRGEGANDFTSGYVAVAGFHGRDGTDLLRVAVAGIDILLHPRVSSKLSIKATCFCLSKCAPMLVLALILARHTKLDLFLSSRGNVRVCGLLSSSSDIWRKRIIFVSCEHEHSLRQQFPVALTPLLPTTRQCSSCIPLPPLMPV